MHTIEKQGEYKDLSECRGADAQSSGSSLQALLQAGITPVTAFSGKVGERRQTVSRAV